jgi:hypothetical protein
MEVSAASIVVTADYGSGDSVAWDDLRRCLAALARQDFEEPFEVILVESRELLPRVPADLSLLLPAQIGSRMPGSRRRALTSSAYSTQTASPTPGGCVLSS